MKCLGSFIDSHRKFAQDATLDGMKNLSTEILRGPNGSNLQGMENLPTIL